MLMAKQLRGDSIALTEGLLIAGWWLLGDGLALSGASRQLSQRESHGRRALSFVQIHRKPDRKGAVCGQNAKKSVFLLPNGAKRAIL